MLQHHHAASLDLAFHRGMASGQHYAQSLLKPGMPLKRPRNPYWCPIRAFTWRLAFALSAYDILDRGY
jgi:hypothetical protein